MKDIEELATRIVTALKDQQKKISTAESCTGGFIASCITDIPGASKVFLGSMVVYTEEMKKNLLQIPDEIFRYGIISPQMAEEMALRVRKITGSDYSISTTGNLGPDTMEGKPKGLIYVAVSTPKEVYVKELNLKGDRLSNKKETTKESFKLLLSLL
ncbi:MAG: CinA family protein [Thermodesulfovibrio sp.]